MPTLSRTLVALAVHCLGDRRREWGQAMQAEFEVADGEGRPLAFAVGCLSAAARELPAHPEGRFAILSHLVALFLFVPAGALLVSSVGIGFPTSFFEVVGAHDLLAAGREQAPLFSEANRSAIPSLGFLVIALAALNLRLAWLALDHDWARLWAVAAMSAAVTVTLVLFTAVVFADYAAAIAHAGVLAVELLALSALARRHAYLQSAAVRQFPAH